VLPGLTSAAALALWAFIGLESATVPAEEVKDPERTIPRATVLGTPALHTWLSGVVLQGTNRRGSFDNLSDTEDGLREILSDAFAAVDVEVVGAVAIFSAARPFCLPQ